MNVRILRQEGPDSSVRWEGFNVEVTGDMSIAALLDHINYNDDIIDDEGNATTRIGWECSCLQGACGSCAMVVNGRPVLACETFVRDIKGDVIEIRPLQKFPVLRDLIVDRSSIHENLMRANMCIESYEPDDTGSQAKRERRQRHQYEIAKCSSAACVLRFAPTTRTVEASLARCSRTIAIWWPCATRRRRPRPGACIASTSAATAPRHCPAWTCAPPGYRPSRPWRT